MSNRKRPAGRISAQVRPRISADISREVARACLCLHVQRAARTLARHFDEVFRPLDLTNGQFSLMMSLNRPEPPTMGETAAFLAMDRTTLTAALKSLAQRGLVAIQPDPMDRRSKRLALTAAGAALLGKAHPLWSSAHAEIDAMLAPAGPGQLRGDLARLVQRLSQNQVR
jgi:DNA-binding MarR family transcriptional regulator